MTVVPPSGRATNVQGYSSPEVAMLSRTSPRCSVVVASWAGLLPPPAAAWQAAGGCGCGGLAEKIGAS